MPEPSIPNLDDSAVLQVSTGVEIRLHPPDTLRVRAGGSWLDLKTHALQVLEAFLQPRLVKEAIKEFGARTKGRHDWMDMMSTFVLLWRNGILTDVREERAAFRPVPHGFDEPTIHARMLNDRSRVTGFLNAIREVVREGDIVVDIGTGTGVLAVAAAQAGARRVYAIEATNMIDRAREVFDRNGVSDRVVCMQGWSTEIELPERADVVVSETFGSEPGEEGAIKIFDDAARRFLAPGGRLIPYAFAVYAVPVVAPTQFYDRNLFTEAKIEEWRRDYAVDFSPLVDHVGERMILCRPRIPEAKGWPQLSSPIALDYLTLGQSEAHPREVQSSFEIERDGDMGGVLVYFDLFLSPKQRLTTKPDVTHENCSWTSVVWVLSVPRKVAVGDRVEILYRTRSEREREHERIVLRHASRS